MFKMVKVGDTSLQYTIVSQTDESSSTCASAAAVHKSVRTKRKTRYRKAVILILITLIMGCGIVIAAVLVPILVANKLVGNLPESAKFQTFAIAASSIQGYGKYDHNGHKYVELLPIRQHPRVESIIDFQDEIQMEKNPNTPTTPTTVSTTSPSSHQVVTSVTPMKTSTALSTTKVTDVSNTISSTNTNGTTTVLLLLKYLNPRN